jgi:chromosome segregation ATPase
MALKTKDSVTNLRPPRGGRMMSTGDIVKTPTSSFLSKHSGGHHGSFLDGNDETNSLVEKLNNVKEELKITQESFISRERAYKIRIDELEEQLAKKRREKIGWMDRDPKIGELKKKQAQILSNVALVQDRFSRVVREQETDLLRAFQARLLDVQAELEMQKSKKDDGAVAYIELSKAKEYEVEKEKVKADLKERQNQALLQANNRLKSQFASREEDRNYLVMQINMARTDNARLRNEFGELEAENKKLEAQVRTSPGVQDCVSVLLTLCS